MPRGTVAAIVRASPGSRIIVTSRAPLHVNGEHDLPVAPLAQDARRAVPRSRTRGPTGLGARGRPLHRRGDLPAARRPAVGHRARRGARDAPPAGGDPRPAHGSSAAARDPVPATPRCASARSMGPWHGATTSSILTGRHCSMSLRSSTEGSIWRRSTPSPGQRRAVGDRLDDLVELADRSLIVADPSGRRTATLPDAPDDPVVRAGPAHRSGSRGGCSTAARRGVPRTRDRG